MLRHILRGSGTAARMFFPRTAASRSLASVTPGKSSSSTTTTTTTTTNNNNNNSSSSSSNSYTPLPDASDVGTGEDLLATILAEEVSVSKERQAAAAARAAARTQSRGRGRGDPRGPRQARGGPRTASDDSAETAENGGDFGDFGGDFGGEAGTASPHFGARPSRGSVRAARSAVEAEIESLSKLSIEELWALGVHDVDPVRLMLDRHAAIEDAKKSLRSNNNNNNNNINSDGGKATDSSIDDAETTATSTAADKDGHVDAAAASRIASVLESSSDLAALRDSGLSDALGHVLVEARAQRGGGGDPAKPRFKRVDAHGRAYATGKRKAAVARVYVSDAAESGTTRVAVNGADVTEYFAQAREVGTVTSPLLATRTLGKYDVRASVAGGGVSGQAQAVALGVAKALINMDPSLRPTLRTLGMLKRDPRVVERKKVGRVKARKSPTWVKR